MRPPLSHLLPLFWTLLLPAASAAQSIDITLSIAGHQLRAEVAASPDSRSQGLMFRERMEANRGMLFVFPEITTQSMWMMNTLIPLSVAFIGPDGRILNIRDMTPHTLDIHSSEGSAAYALEMNRGWFAQRGIGRGARVEGLERAPPPE
ncbi:MAG: DUF192 domain-containing protein [Burkholderiales bacterium]|nr:DUF192 domain-containing protein [Burkholderiales bacterium]